MILSTLVYDVSRQFDVLGHQCVEFQKKKDANIVKPLTLYCFVVHFQC